MANCSGKCVIREVKYSVQGRVTGTFPGDASGGAPMTAHPTNDEVEKEVVDACERYFNFTFGQSQCNDGCHCSKIQGQAEPKWTKWEGPRWLEHTWISRIEKGGFSWVLAAEVYFASRAWDGLCNPDMNEEEKHAPGYKPKPVERPKIKATKYARDKREQEMEVEKQTE